MALEIGRAALAEYNQPKAPGTATKRGYIKDRQGNEQPVWKVRAGDRVNITDYPDGRNHLVFETSYDHNNQTVQLSTTARRGSTRSSTGTRTGCRPRTCP
jgi:hypothetical protein